MALLAVPVTVDVARAGRDLSTASLSHVTVHATGTIQTEAHKLFHGPAPLSHALAGRSGSIATLCGGAYWRLASAALGASRSKTPEQVVEAFR